MTIIENLKMSNTYKLFCHCNIFPVFCGFKKHEYHKGLQFVKLIEEKFKQYNSEERKK